MLFLVYKQPELLDISRCTFQFQANTPSDGMT